MILLAKLGIGVLGTAVVTGAALSSEGFIHVNVNEKAADGHHINLIVPAALVPVTLKFVPRQNLAEAAQNIRANMALIDAALPALEQCPDGVFVEVTEPGEHVRVAKVGSSIVIDVKDSDETVHVSVPLRAAESAIHEIAAANRPM
jgi:hypothetical protein